MKRKGFTLIELLAVIVILAIIALIAVPIVINIINDAKKGSLQRSVDLYIDTVQKRITQENMKTKYDPEECVIQANGNVKCYIGEEVLKTSTGEDELKIEMNGKKPKDGVITFKTKSTNTDSNKITYTGVVLEGTEYTAGQKPKEYVPPILITNDDYRGYYADVDGDGEADGIIYADLGANITYPQSGNFYNTVYNWSKDDGAYSYTKGNGLKEYIISKNKYTEGKFGEKEIISVKKGSKGNPRFYVMSLSDFTTEAYTTYCWYKNAMGKMPNTAKDTKTGFGEGYNNTGKIIEIWNKNGEFEGWTTGAMQDNQDIWKYIQEKYNSKEKWYIPSRGEWAAFANYLKEEQALTNNCSTSSCNDNGNYDDKFELNAWYWTSSQYNAEYSWFATLSGGRMRSGTINDTYYIRLGATF